MNGLVALYQLREEEERAAGGDGGEWARKMATLQEEGVGLLREGLKPVLLSTPGKWTSGSRSGDVSFGKLEVDLEPNASEIVIEFGEPKRISSCTFVLAGLAWPQQVTLQAMDNESGLGWTDMTTVSQVDNVDQNKIVGSLRSNTWRFRFSPPPAIAPRLAARVDIQLYEFSLEIDTPQVIHLVHHYQKRVGASCPGEFPAELQARQDKHFRVDRLRYQSAQMNVKVSASEASLFG
jgi:hypothetical protein